MFLPGESQGWQSLVGCRLWRHTESDMTGQLNMNNNNYSEYMSVCVCVCVSVYIHINILTHRIKQLSDQLTQAPNKPGWRGTARPSAEQVFGAFLHSWGGAAPAHPPTSLRSRLPLPAKMFCPNRHGPQSVSLTHL